MFGIKAAGDLGFCIIIIPGTSAEAVLCNLYFDIWHSRQFLILWVRSHWFLALQLWTCISMNYVIIIITIHSKNILSLEQMQLLLYTPIKEKHPMMDLDYALIISAFGLHISLKKNTEITTWKANILDTSIYRPAWHSLCTVGTLWLSQHTHCTSPCAHKD